MTNADEVNEILNKIIETQKHHTIEKNHFCCGVLSISKPVRVIETDILELIYSENGNCEVRRKKNGNPVILRDEHGKIYRLHGEWTYLKPEMYRLAGLHEKAEACVSKGFNYDV